MYKTDYDELFKKYVLAPFDWLQMKAQGIAESNLDPDANSPAGARGIMQIMPATGKDLGVNDPLDLYDPEISIRIGCKYMSWKWYEWTGIIVDQSELLKFSLASYNAGYGNIRKAFNYAISVKWEAKDWSIVGGLCLRKFTGEKNTIQTVNYVARILRIYRELQEAK